MNVEDIEYLQEHLHSPAMQCRQCDITRALIREHALLTFRVSERVAAHVFTPAGEYLGLISQATFEDADLDIWENEGGR